MAKPSFQPNPMNYSTNDNLEPSQHATAACKRALETEIKVLRSLVRVAWMALRAALLKAKKKRKLCRHIRRQEGRALCRLSRWQPLRGSGKVQ